EAIGIRLKAGRSFTDQDGRAAQQAELEAAAAAQERAKALPAGSPPPPPAPPPARARSVIVNKRFAKTFWPGVGLQDVVGKRISFNGDTQPWIDVVGVTADVKHYGLERPMRPGIYFPAPQMAGRTNSMAVVVETAGEAEGVTSTVRNLVREID